ncbi:hypothetical protein [Jannaschia pohangensis]|uniref:hypothetical protein n=1 Tax=Jannaschia pohangensis TaxID=390807 RepID=UPI001113AFA9|nr:hypothetical protein [Jannaschia pohangensis]
MHRKFILPALFVVGALSGCVTQGDLVRGGVGAGLGCVAGEIIEDGRCVEGAVVGGGAAVIGGRL